KRILKQTPSIKHHFLHTIHQSAICFFLRLPRQGNHNVRSSGGCCVLLSIEIYPGVCGKVSETVSITQGSSFRRILSFPCQKPILCHKIQPHISSRKLPGQKDFLWLKLPTRR